MTCEECNRPMVSPLSVKADAEDDEGWCDSCGGLAVEWPKLGWVCVQYRQPLVTVGQFYLYHPQDVSLWRRLKWAWV